MSNRKSEELLPPAAADRAAGVRLEKSEEINIINRLGRSTHPNEKSVLRSGATPVLCRDTSGVRVLESLNQPRRRSGTAAIFTSKTNVRAENGCLHEL
jgi:hypothetical protein